MEAEAYKVDMACYHGHLGQSSWRIVSDFQANAFVDKNKC